ncbi:hypothetical protein ACFQ1S_06665 [Kibdelosporangium lantanae]|uniref:Uncharacterized protein n=1 Tax=Kibdelosporangium lantanae TaxID=1497396 RepID=A0ABW3M3T1_9PSEU
MTGTDNLGPWRTNWKPVLGEAGLLHELAAEHNLPVADLNRGFALIPLTKAVLADLGVSESATA